jgi:hypothetical protein
LRRNSWPLRELNILSPPPNRAGNKFLLQGAEIKARPERALEFPN